MSASPPDSPKTPRKKEKSPVGRRNQPSSPEVELETKGLGDRPITPPPTSPTAPSAAAAIGPTGDPRTATVSAGRGAGAAAAGPGAGAAGAAGVTPASVSAGASDSVSAGAGASATIGEGGAAAVGAMANPIEMEYQRQAMLLRHLAGELRTLGNPNNNLPLDAEGKERLSASIDYIKAEAEGIKGWIQEKIRDHQLNQDYFAHLNPFFLYIDHQHKKIKDSMTSTPSAVASAGVAGASPTRAAAAGSSAARVGAGAAPESLRARLNNLARGSADDSALRTASGKPDAPVRLSAMDPSLNARPTMSIPGPLSEKEMHLFVNNLGVALQQFTGTAQTIKQLPTGTTPGAGITHIDPINMVIQQENNRLSIKLPKDNDKLDMAVAASIQAARSIGRKDFELDSNNLESLKIMARRAIHEGAEITLSPASQQLLAKNNLNQNSFLNEQAKFVHDNPEKYSRAPTPPKPPSEEREPTERPR